MTRDRSLLVLLAGWLLLALAAISGLLVALARSLPEPVGIALGVLIGIAVGLDSPPEVLSVREAGATSYLNFGRNWTRGFAVTISRRIVGDLGDAGIVLKSLENRRIRVRGWVEGRPSRKLGPRIALRDAGQIEVPGTE